MRCLLLLFLFVLAGCHPSQPSESAVDVPTDEADDETAGGESAAAPEGDGVESGAAEATEPARPRVTGLVDELTTVIAAALAGRELPETSMQLPGVRGEQVVAVQGGQFPEGALTAEAAMFKVDVTLDSCDPAGLTIGLLQIDAGVFIVGLGDQFRHSTGPTLESISEVVNVTSQTLIGIAAGTGDRLLLTDAQCEETFGRLDMCRRMFPEVPDRSTMTRYNQLLFSCMAQRVYSLEVVALWLRDASGNRFQALARMTTHRGRLAVAEPISIAPGLR